jgi:integrase
MIAKPAYAYLCHDSDRHGRVRYRLRMPGRKTVTIKGHFGSAEFAENYRAAVEGSPVERKIAGGRGSVAALAHTYLGSAIFAGLATGTQKSRRYFVEYVVAKYGDCPIADLDQNIMKQIMRKYGNRPGMARNILSVFRILIAFAMEEGIRKDDPTTGVKRPKLNADGWHTWSEEEIVQYEAKHPIGSPARLAFALALYTGQRASDLIRMGRQHVKNGQISVAQQKTGARLWIPLHPHLKAILDATPSDHLTFIVTEHGKPYSAGKAFGARMGSWAREAGLKNCPLHGLRKACCRRLAEANCNIHEIKAISGHKSIGEVERYTAAVDQKAMAERAIARMLTTHTAIPNYPQEKKG